MKFKKTQDKIDFLKKCANLYENGGISPITNKEFDKLYLEAKKEEPENEFFKEVGAEPNFGKRVKHDKIMGSLTKCANIEEFEKWFKNYKVPKEKFLKDNFGFLLQPKLDGVAVSLLYVFGQLQLAATRGNGEYGVDITQAIRQIDDIPNEIRFKISPLEIRGEVFKDQEDFENWAGDYANPRNFTAGTLNLKNMNKVKQRKLSFIAYDILGQPFVTETIKLNFLEQLPIRNILPETAVAQGTMEQIVEQVKEYAKNQMEIRDSQAFPIDGVVIKLNDCALASSLGVVNKKPKANTALKLPVEQKWTTLKEIKFKTTRTGKISVVGKLEPITLAQTKVSRVTLYNLDFIEKQGLKIGSEVLIQKSGDIIPRLMRARKGKDERFVSYPEYCESCGEVLSREDKFLRCTNLSCPAQLDARIEYFLNSLMIKGFGETTISKLTNFFKINSIYHFYHIFNFRFKEIENLLGTKTANNLKEALNSKQEITLIELLSAYNLGGFSSIMKNLVEGLEIKTLRDLEQISANDIINIKGFGKHRAEKFMKDLINNFGNLILIREFLTLKEPQKSLENSFCFTGKFEKPRKELENIVLERGGTIKKGVSSNLDYLVWDGQIDSSKYRKAFDKSVSIISYPEFTSLIS